MSVVDGLKWAGWVGLAGLCCGDDSKPQACPKFNYKVQSHSYQGHLSSAQQIGKFRVLYCMCGYRLSAELLY